MLSRSCFVLSRLCNYLDTSTLRTSYCRLFYPYIKYCGTAWESAADCYLKPIVYMQKIILRYICHVPINTLFLKIVLLKLNEVFDLQVNAKYFDRIWCRPQQFYISLFSSCIWYKIFKVIKLCNWKTKDKTWPEIVQTFRSQVLV